MNRFQYVYFLMFVVLLSSASGQESTHQDLRYSEEFERSTLDLWLPDSEQPAPLVVYFHGGGLRGGDKGRIQFKEDFLTLPERGVAFASVGYPLMGDLRERKDLSEMDKRMLIFDQAFQAIEFLKKRASDYKLDAERIVVAGSSAGAGISNYLTYDKKAGITACVAIQQARGASHYAQFIEKDSPTLILYTSSGPEDKVHNPSNAQLLKDHCDQVDSPCFLYGSPKSGLPAVPEGKAFVAHAMSLIDSIWSSSQPSEAQLGRLLKRFPEADTNQDGKLTRQEAQQFAKSRQSNRRPAAAAQPPQDGDREKGGGPDQETKEQFIKRVEKNTKKDGSQLDRKSIEARFQEMDANQDGIVTREERRARLKEAPKVEAPKVEAPSVGKATVGPIFSTEEILDENTLETKILQDWHVDEVTGATRQKLIEINVAELWPGQDYRIPVRMIVPLQGKAKGFRITGANAYEGLMKDSKPSEFEAKLLAGGVGLVKTVVNPLRRIPGKGNLERQMMAMMQKERNPRYSIVWIWSMTLMRATTAAYAEGDHFEKGKVAGSGSSKNGISPAVALIHDERFTATCSRHAFAYFSPARRDNWEKMEPADEANQASMDRFMRAICVTENWDRLMERSVDVLFQPGTHDYVAFDILWGAQNHPQLPVYYQPNGGHSQTPHVATAKDEQNQEAFLWHHFFGGEPLLTPPKSSYQVDKDKLVVSVSFDEGPQPKSGRIWWIYNRAPASPTRSSPFLEERIPDDQWMDMEFEAKTGAWTATIPLKDGCDRIDFFSNHGHTANGYQQYLSSPYTRVEFAPSAQPPSESAQRQSESAQQPSESAQQPSKEQVSRILRRFPQADKDQDGELSAEEFEAVRQMFQSRQRNRRPAPAAQPPEAGNAGLAEMLEAMNSRFKNVEVELLEWPDELHRKLGKMTNLALLTRPVKKVEGKLPLLINLHGGGQRWFNNSLQQQLQIAQQLGMKRGFDLAELAGRELVVLDPNTAERWDADWLDKMLDYVLKTFPEIDQDRVYVMGYSAGGGATWRWINQSPDRFAAAAPCGFTGGSANDDSKKLAKLPIWAMAGGDDGKNPAGIRRMVERLRNAGNSNVKHTEFEGADHRAGGMEVFRTAELVEWMLRFKRSKNTE